MTYTEILRRRAKKSTTGKVGGKLSSYQIILAPVYTEKSAKLSEDANKYVFKVHKDANKIDVINAIQSIYDVDVAKVNIIRVPHKGRAMRKTVRRPYKKAIITLQGDKKIELIG
jgi:large subunit ribosomal protein L23